MKSPLGAMVWELWRTSRMEILLRIGLLWSFALLVFSLSRGLDEVQLLVIRGILIMIFLASSVFSVTWLHALDNSHMGFSFHLGFTRPISTPKLVLVPLAYSILTAVACYLSSAAMFGWLLDAAMPLLGPATIAAVAVCLFIAAVWSPTSQTGRFLGLFAITLVSAIVIGFFFQPRGQAEPILLRLGRPEYFDLSALHYLLLVGVAGLAAAFTTVAVDCQRHGEKLLPISFGQRLPSEASHAYDGCETNTVSSTGRSTSVSLARPAGQFVCGPWVAQAWYEARRAGPGIWIMCLGAPLGLALILTGALFIKGDHWPDTPRIWLGVIGLSPLVFQLLGAAGVVGLQSRQGHTELSAFDAIRPLRCDQAMAIKLLVVAGWSLFGTLATASIAALHTTLSGEWYLWSEWLEPLKPLLGQFSWSWGVLAMLGGVLGFVSSTSAMLALALWLPLHPRILSGLAVVLTLHMGIFAWDTGHGQQLGWLWRTYGYAIPTAIVAISLSSIYRALSAGYLSRWYFGGTMAVWAAYVSIGMAVLLRAAPVVAMAPMAWYFGIACLLLPLATTACAPLALAAHRHIK